MTPKQRVVARHPKAYSVRYDGGTVCVYEKPAKAVPRGLMPHVVVLGVGGSTRDAWLDAAKRLPPEGT